MIQRKSLSTLVAMALGLAAFSSSAQTFPSGPVKIIVPFTPGSATDILARVTGERLAPVLGQPVIVENRAGAGGNIGAEAVAKAAPDGYTLLMATTGVMAINNALYKLMPYDAAADLLPVIYAASITNVLAVPVDLPAKNVTELVALAEGAEGVTLRIGETDCTVVVALADA